MTRRETIAFLARIKEICDDRDFTDRDARSIASTTLGLGISLLNQPRKRRPVPLSRIVPAVVRDITERAQNRKDSTP